jgi:hypothetical protein
LLGISILVSANSCATKYPPPHVETCIHNQDNSAQCNDIRKPVGEQDYQRNDMTNYICTNALDYESMYGYMNKLRSDLIKCENKLR